MNSSDLIPPSPFAAAAIWHQTHCPETPFRDVVEAHFQTGYVISSPDLFILARQIWRHWPAHKISDPWETSATGDSWHIWLFAGDLSAIPSIIPYKLPFVTYHRGDRLMARDMTRLLDSLPRLYRGAGLVRTHGITSARLASRRPP